MKRKVDWQKMDYTDRCLIREECRSHKCEWQVVRKGKACNEEFKVCPECGSDTDKVLWCGGLLVRYNRVKDNFDFLDPDDRF